MKKIKSFTLIYVISILCITQVKAQPSELGVENPNQLDSLIRESLILRHGGSFNKGNKKPYFIIKEGIPAGFNFDSMMREFNVRFVNFNRNGLWGYDIKPNGDIKYKNFTKYFNKRNRNYSLQIHDITVNDIYIYIYISINIVYKGCFAWRGSILPSIGFMRFGYEYSPNEKKWNLINIIDASNQHYSPPLKIFPQY